MRAVIVFTDDQGKTWEFELRPAQATPQGAGLDKKRTPTRAKAKAEPPIEKRTGATPDFRLSMAAFMNRYARGSGAQKFAILLARLTKGDTKLVVESKEIERQWKRMKRHLGEFNGAHGTRAKDAGWVDTPKRGTYVLLSDWKSALSS
jgi:hypothetical protein